MMNLAKIIINHFNSNINYLIPLLLTQESKIPLILLIIISEIIIFVFRLNYQRFSSFLGQHRTTWTADLQGLPSFCNSILCWITSIISPYKVNNHDIIIVIQVLSGDIYDLIHAMKEAVVVPASAAMKTRTSSCITAIFL